MKLLEMNDATIKLAKEVAVRMGFSQFVYTTSSAIPGLFCLRAYARQKGGVIVNTKEFGLMYMADMDDLNFTDLAEKQRASHGQKKRRLS